MGWANCGVDTAGRPVGYSVTACCDHPRCSKKIDRGLDYACGSEHGETEYSCEKYFCASHRGYIFIECISGIDGASVCDACQMIWEEEHAKECKPCAIALES